MVRHKRDCLSGRLDKSRIHNYELKLPISIRFRSHFDIGSFGYENNEGELWNNTIR